MRVFLSLFLLTALLVSCQPSSEPAGPQPSASSSASPSAAAPEASISPLPGGQAQQPVDSPEAKAMRSNAENLLNQKYAGAGISLGEITSFTTQVVAGTNYRLKVAYTDQAGHSGMVNVTIFKDLDGNYSLSADDYKP